MSHIYLHGFLLVCLFSKTLTVRYLGFRIFWMGLIVLWYICRFCIHVILKQFYFWVRSVSPLGSVITRINLFRFIYSIWGLSLVLNCWMIPYILGFQWFLLLVAFLLVSDMDLQVTDLGFVCLLKVPYLIKWWYMGFREMHVTVSGLSCSQNHDLRS